MTKIGVEPVTSTPRPALSAVAGWSMSDWTAAFISATSALCPSAPKEDVAKFGSATCSERSTIIELVSLPRDQLQTA